MKILMIFITALSLVLNIAIFSNLPFKKINKILKKENKENFLGTEEKVRVTQKIFHVSDFLKPRVFFWEDIYAKYTSDFSIIHDNEHMFVYEVIDFTYLKVKNYRPIYIEITRRNKITEAKTKIVETLSKLANLKTKKGFKIENLTDFERRIYEKVTSIKGYNFLTARNNIREQLGQKDMVEQALRRSKNYLSSMEKIFIQKGVPKELVVLSFAESSFNVEAESSVGAAGIWQIMPEMGTKFLNMNDYVDERKDPIRATEIAALILKESYTVLKDWPMAIMSYNVGWPEIRKTLKKVNGKSVDDLIKQRQSRTIGFAAKNFYAGFVAMLNVYSNRKDIFPGLDKVDRVEFKTVLLQHTVKLRDFLVGSKMSLTEFKMLNPEFKKIVFMREKKLIKGTKIKIPNRTIDESL